MATRDVTPSSDTQELLERDRKAEHIKLGLSRRMQLEASFFDAYSFEHVALPEIDLAEIDTSCRFLGKPLKAPLLISCMTGGTEMAHQINRNLAIAAEATGVALGVGSQRRAIEDPSQAYTFQVRDLAPTIPLVGNLGAVQLNYGYGLDQCEQAVAMIQADALALHLNPLQEAIQPEGDGDFRGLIAKIGQVAAELSVPVIAKEIGCGLSRDVGQALRNQGIEHLDVAGLGGTSWARIEGARAEDMDLGDLFADWGIPTPRSIEELSRLDGVSVIGSGGIRTGIEAAKALALGADLVGSAYPFLQAAVQSPEAVIERIGRTVQELRICMFCVGARSIRDLQGTPLHKKGHQ